MSQPRRRRRRRRRAQPGAPSKSSSTSASSEASPLAAAEGDARAGRSRRRRRRSRGTESRSPKSSEDLVRATERLDRSSLENVHDGRTMEAVIGELQSEWGVPQSPQEYRITLKVAEEREARGEHVASIEEVRDERPPRSGDNGGQPRREKAPAVPRIGSGPSEQTGEGAPEATRRKRGRRRKRKRPG